MNLSHLLLACASLAAATPVAAGHETRLGPITIVHPYARPTAPGQPVGGAYLRVVNQGPAERLVSARTEVAAGVELHSMHMEGDVMRMREIAAVELPAGRSVELKPGGMHLMLVGLKAPLEMGASFPLTLKFERAGEVVVTVQVETGASAAGRGAAKH